MVCSAIPMFFLSEELLKEVVDKGTLAEEEKAVLWTYYQQNRKQLLSVLDIKQLHLVLPLWSDEREDEQIRISLADLFLEKDLFFTARQYGVFLQQLEELRKDYPHFSVETDSALPFRNINIAILNEKMVLVSKENSPAIHFVIHHPKMVRAFRNYIPPIAEQS